MDDEASAIRQTLPDGSIIPVEPGYEKPQTGATSNFVGNHMTQGAIDLAGGVLRTST